MGIRESSYGYWSSNLTFLWVAAGAAIGIGNVVRLPYLAGEYGGSIFLAAYVLALLMVGWPLMLAEWMIGRWTRDDLISGLHHLAEAATAQRAWVLVGWASLVGAVLILSYYSVVAGWSMAYTFRAAGGALSGLNENGAHELFYALAQDPERGLAWHTIFMVVACVIVIHGVREGIERASAYLLPTAFVLALVLLIYGSVYGNAAAALRYVFAPDWGRFGWRGLMEALHQAYFTLALGLGAMFAYGSYLPAQAPLGRLALGVITLDTVFSLLVGCAMYSLVFAAGLDPAPSLTLQFQVFPLSLPAGLAGIATATLFYVILFMITMTAAVALMEPAVRFLMDSLRITRVFAATYSSIIIWYIGLGTLLSFSIVQNWQVFGRNFFDWVQFLTGRLLVPGVGLLLCIFIARIMPEPLVQELWGERSKILLRPWLWLLRYPVRIALIVVLLYTTGVLDFMVELWS